MSTEITARLQKPQQCKGSCGEAEMTVRYLGISICSSLGLLQSTLAGREYFMRKKKNKTRAVSCYISQGKKKELKRQVKMLEFYNVLVLKVKPFSCEGKSRRNLFSLYMSPCSPTCRSFWKINESWPWLICAGSGTDLEISEFGNKVGSSLFW